MNHKVNNVQKLHDDAMYLYNHVVVGGETSADSILNNLAQGIENLKVNWKGKDAGLRIQEVIRVHNAMIAIRNALAQLAVDSSKVAANYREIQNANGAGMETLGTLSFETKTILGDYSDNADTIDINPNADAGKRFIDNGNNAMDQFVSAVKLKYSDIMENWQAGTGRDAAQTAFDSFVTNVNTYKQTLADVSSNITKALQNYTF